MIIKTSGDILLTSCEYLVQGIAEGKMEDMRTGLAREIHMKWPESTIKFKKWRLRNKFSGGNLYIDSENQPKIVNLATQRGLLEADIHYVNRALKNLANFLKKQSMTTVAMPKIGCGYGKLEWNTVEASINKELNGIEHNIFLYGNYKKGSKSLEEANYFHN